MKFTAVGDILCQRRLPDTYDGFEEIKDFILKGDARFFNLETTVNREGECYACQQSGGTYVRCEPEVMEDMLKFGFNLTTFNNNHVMDFDRLGIVKTYDYVSKTGVVHAGVGMNLHKASAPSYLETPDGRVALIAVNTAATNFTFAGEQSRRFPGRPGTNGIQVSEKLMLPEKEFEQIKEIGDKSGINEHNNILRDEGYLPLLPDGVCELGKMQFIKGDKYDTVKTAAKSDVERVKAFIQEAKLESDYVMVSIHSHDDKGGDKRAVPDFLEQICHEFIDAGADAVVGHGPHLLRPVEIYNGKPIFYSLGDFVIQLYQVPAAPEDFYKKQGMTSDDSVISLLEKRSKGFTIGLMEDHRMLETVIPYWETDENRNITKLVFKPVIMSKNEGKHLEGLPTIPSDISFLEQFKEICKPYGTELTIENGMAVCKL